MNTNRNTKETNMSFDSQAIITAEDIRGLEDRFDFHGFGYLGASERTGTEDVKLAQAARKLDLDIEDVFLWANSTYGRHFMANAPHTIRAYKEELDESLPLLRSHNLAYIAEQSTKDKNKRRREAARHRVEIRIRHLREEANRLERALEGQRW
jgi:hypothetical protein